jgi:two-component system OmpR family response regulator
MKETAVPILVVEDEPDIARMLTVAMHNEGYAVHAVHTGKDALAFATAHPIAAVICDIHLPDTHGLMLSQQLRAAVGPTPPILILSGDSSMSVINSLSQAGATYYFRKPVDIRQLLDRISELLAVAKA